MIHREVCCCQVGGSSFEFEEVSCVEQKLKEKLNWKIRKQKIETKQDRNRYWKFFFMQRKFQGIKNSQNLSRKDVPTITQFIKVNY